MNHAESCQHGSSAPVELLRSLPTSQARTARHKCTVCGYQRGFEDAQWGGPLLVAMEDCGHDRVAPVIILKDLPESQAGTGRHKCATCAYQMGFEVGLQEQSAYRKLFTKRVHNPRGSEPFAGGNSILTIVKPPDLGAPTRATTSSFKARKMLKRSFMDHRNLKLGRAGELLVLDYERASLHALGKVELARHIVHTSEVEGDGAGFDIKSFHPSGKIKFIEVKTTGGAESTPFLVTYNEVEFSRQHVDQYYLYRVFDFDLVRRSGKSYVVQGRLNKSFNLSATVFRASRT